MFRKQSFLYSILIFFFGSLSQVLSGPLDEFSEEKKTQWIRKLSEPLQQLAGEIERNKNSLESINNELATCLNTATSPVKHCETDFLNPLLNSIKRILLSVGMIDFSKIPINMKDFDDFEDLHWQFVNADNPVLDECSKAVEIWKQGEGEYLTKCIKSAFMCSDELKILLSNYPKLNSFLESFRSEKRANVNIITIGCANDWKQQVYPWVIAFAKQKPELTFAIDLFDQWEAGQPEFLEESALVWKTEDGEKYIHENIEVNVRTYIPGAMKSPDGPGYFVTDFHKILSTLIRKRLENDVVIVSEHTGGYVLDKPYVGFYNQIYYEDNDLKKRFFLATHQGGFGSMAYDL